MWTIVVDDLNGCEVLCPSRLEIKTLCSVSLTLSRVTALIMA